MKNLVNLLRNNKEKEEIEEMIAIQKYWKKYGKKGTFHPNQGTIVNKKHGKDTTKP